MQKQTSRHSRVITVSEIRGFVYCPRSWKLRRSGLVQPPEAINYKELQYGKGNRFHRDHGQEVSRAKSQLGRSVCITMVLLAVSIAGGLAWKFL